MTVLLNELLEEAITRANELADEAVEAGQEAAAVLQRAQGLRDETERQAEEAHERFRALQEQLEDALREREEIGTETTTALEAARRRAGTVEKDVAELLEASRRSLAALEQQRQHLREAFAERIRETQGKASRLTRELQDVEQAAAAGLSAASEALGRLGQQVHETHQALVHARDEWGVSTRELAKAVQVEVQQLQAKRTRVMGDHAARLDDLKQRLASEHNKAVGTLLEALGDDAADELATRFKPLFDAGEKLEEDWDAATDSLGEGYRELGTRLRDVAGTATETARAAAGVEQELA
jgi:DNA repair exonuclease SbcCD ATPase subunit